MFENSSRLERFSLRASSPDTMITGVPKWLAMLAFISASAVVVVRINNDLHRDKVPDAVRLLRVTSDMSPPEMVCARTPVEEAQRCLRRPGAGHVGPLGVLAPVWYPMKIAPSNLAVSIPTVTVCKWLQIRVGNRVCTLHHHQGSGESSHDLHVWWKKFHQKILPCPS